MILSIKKTTQKYRYVVEVLVETDRHETKKAIKEAVALALTTTLYKAKVRKVDID